MNIYPRSFQYELVDKLIYIGSFIPPAIRRPPPLKEVAFASAFFGAIVFAMRKEIKSIADYAIRTFETEIFRNKPCQVFQRIFKV